MADQIGDSELCACCGEHTADMTFPGLTPQHRDLAGRPIATACVIAALSIGGGALFLTERIRARDAKTAV